MILSYHRVNPWYKDDALTVSVENFERQILYLIKKGYKFISLKDYISTNSNKKHIYISLTFDDGFADNFWYAFPLLKKYKIPATIFLIAGFVGKDLIFNRYRDKEKDRFLKWEEVKEMIDSDIDFGSHSLTHPHLTEIDDNKAWEEIYNSKVMIEEKLGKKVDFFCYPYGEFDERIVSMVKKAGYKGAVVTLRKKLKNGRFTLPRTGIYGHNNFLIFRIKIWRGILISKKFYL